MLLVFSMETNVHQHAKLYKPPNTCDDLNHLKATGAWKWE